MTIERIKSHIKKSILTKEKMLSDKAFIANLYEIVAVLVSAYKKNKKILIAGNGGSAADSQHIACELVSRLYTNRPAIFALALNTNSSLLTAVANDFSYDKVFSRQIEALGVEGDVFIALSTSGNSKNIVEALKRARKEGLVSIGFTGEKPCDMDKLCDYLVKVPSSNTPTIQESHITLAHVISELVEDKIKDIG